VIICHRPSFPALVRELERLQGLGHAVVVDVDDDLGNMPRRGSQADLAAISQMAACRMADWVTASTPALAERYHFQARGTILRNCVPASLLGLPRESDGRTLGWGGLASGHLGDLPTTGGAVAGALEGSGWAFQVVGPAEDVRQQLGLASAPRATGGLSIGTYQEALGLLDVGIVPLADTPFCRAKSALKGLEYAARGVPFVASALPEYELLARENFALIARTPAEWRRHLTDLIRDESLRCEKAAAGLDAVANHHTYEVAAPGWVEAWEAAILTRRSC
jgi:Glycosyl transferases group 1